MTRVLHFSDVHVEAPLQDVSVRDLLNKRLIGLANLRLLRSRRHRDAELKVRALGRFVDEQDIDLVVCTGDYTALGTEPEVARAREVIEAVTHAPLGFVTVPGNHDVYLRDALEEGGRFERHFGDLLETDLPDLRTDGRWPIVRLPTEGLAVVAVDSARPNPAPWLSSGRVPDAQVRGLERAVRDPRLAGRFVIVATHYAPRLATGRPDTRRHGLDNADELLAACAPIERGILVHGHVHHCYAVTLPSVHIGLFGAGSATHAGQEGLWVYDVEPGGGTATPGAWDGERFVLQPRKQLPLP